MSPMLVVLLAALVARGAAGQWTHAAALDGAGGGVLLRWQPRHQEIRFRLEARTRGYVTLGFTSPNNANRLEEDDAEAMVDVVLGWVDDHSQKAVLLDCHGKSVDGKTSPIKDEIDNYTLMSGVQNDTHTILEFRRVLDTCDPDDYILTADTVSVTWSYHANDPQNGGHLAAVTKNYGMQSLHLLGPPPIPQPHDAMHWDVTLNNFEVPNNMNTVYWCKIFKAPVLATTHHIIAYEPLIGPNHTHLLHHMILHECALPAAAPASAWDAYARSAGTFCYGADWPPEWERCLTPLVAWAVGSAGESLPRHVGLPLAPGAFYMLEAHFDNAPMRAAAATSGLRLAHTAERRPHAGAILTTGVSLSSFHFVPPGQRAYATGGLCSGACTRSALPRDGVRAVSVVLHSHLAGRRLRLRHVRGGRELRPLAADNRYDFNYQQARVLAQETVILPGDELLTECEYSTRRRDKATLGGYSTKEEMCLAFVLYYPRTELAGCYSMPPIKYFFEAMGVKEFYGKTMHEIERMFLHGESSEAVVPVAPSKPLFSYKPGEEMSPEANQRAIVALQNAKDYTIEGESVESQTAFDKLIIKEPAEFRNKSFINHLQNMPYKEKVFTKAMEDYFYKGLHLTFCRKRDDTLAIKEQVVKFPNFTEYVEQDKAIQCSYKLKRAPPTAAGGTSSTNGVLIYLCGFLLLNGMLFV